MAVKDKNQTPTRVPSKAVAPGSKDHLTRREEETLWLVAVGLTDGEIAQRLRISVYTAHNHVARLRRKFKVHNRTRLVPIAVRLGLVQEENRENDR
jgi:DNA-binding CsgD family transcriptional regulator